MAFPPGEYTSGTILPRSRVRIWLESGATVFSAKGQEAFPKDALFYGEDLESIALEGRGTIDGRAEYEWRENDIDDRYIEPNRVRAQAAGKSLRRAFPKKDSVGHLLQLVRCRDVRPPRPLVRPLAELDDPYVGLRADRDRWDRRPHEPHRWSLGRWDRSRRLPRSPDLQLARSRRGTTRWSSIRPTSSAPRAPCEDITVTNCRLTSSSSAIKFCDGNQNCVRRVAIDNCVITNPNRGLAFMVFDGGYVSDVTVSNLTIECIRRDWFWWGEGDPIHFNIRRRAELDPKRDPNEDPRPARFEMW